MPNGCEELKYTLEEDDATGATPGVGAYLKSTFKDTLEELGIKDDFRKGLKWEKNGSAINSMSRRKFRLLWLTILNKKFMYEIVYTGIMNYVIMNSELSSDLDGLKKQQEYAAEIAMYAKEYIDLKEQSTGKDIFTTEIYEMCITQDDKGLPIDNGVIMKRIHKITSDAIGYGITRLKYDNMKI